MRATEISSAKDLLTKWVIRAQINIRAHYNSAEIFQHRHYYLGIPLIVLTVIISSDAVFSIIGKEVFHGQLIYKVITVVSVILASFQTFFSFEGKMNRHNATAARYGAVSRKIEKLLSEPNFITKDEIDEIERLINEAVKDSPKPPKRIFKEAEKYAQKFYGLDRD